MLVTVLMPCLNEEGAIGRVIDDIPREALDLRGYQVEILIVDGKSSDRSAEVARGRGARVLASEKGYGRQFRLGLLHAKGEVIVAADSDGSYPLALIPILLDTLTTRGLDFVSLNRFAGLSRNAMDPIRRTGNWALTFLMNLLFGLRLHDSQSGMWALRREALDRLHLTSDGMPFSEEIKLEAFRKLRALEIPGTYHPRIGPSELRPFRDGWCNVMFLIKKFRD